MGMLNILYVVQINEFVKRARAAKIHSYIISHLKKEMPAMIGKAKTQQKLIDNLEDQFMKVPPSPPLYFLSQIYIHMICGQRACMFSTKEQFHGLVT